MLVVFGASGHQGRAVIDSVQNDKLLSEQFKIRGLVHDISSRKARKLTQRGVEVKKVDLSNWTSICEVKNKNCRTKKELYKWIKKLILQINSN